ncbi:Gfo/Idh/MocA family oxidoreductase [Curvibacter sp. CHRR-16]|uniref:Gfo/Idh/MocA family protein n=1 Tax=Curvibacter sp. CHRR-16 TaxID=2835872 RepID=UPI001BD9D805|nr:Gfo/Idh/MocA family oxidoreductase [Curvibacter sp. CHRR-16]MBT0570129.1 Gfo/Idh/MocA family oxidoreductase [Curvibacter sp. CHRR-16]
MSRVRFGIVGVAKIATQKVIPALQQASAIEVAAIASRSLDKAQQAAQALGIAKAYGRYEDLLSDPDIDAIYNPLPNDWHVPLTLAAARAGKHVLCEKPIALTAKEAAQLREVAGHVHIMEGFMVRFHPQWLRARELVRTGRLGELRSMNMQFSYFNADPGNIRNQAALGGGALMDIGCYPVVAGRFFFDAEPVRVLGLADVDARFGVDRTFTALLDFGQGRQLSFTVSTQSAPYQRLQLMGSAARLEMQIPVNAQPQQASRIWWDDGSAPGAAAAQSEDLPPCDQYALMGQAFAQAVQGVHPLPYGVEDAIQNMRILDALRVSAAQGTWQTLSPD